jgi:hypothetical protein
MDTNGQPLNSNPPVVPPPVSPAPPVTAQPFQQQPQFQPVAQPFVQSSALVPPKSKKKLIIIICAIVGVLMAGGVVLMIFLVNEKKDESEKELIERDLVNHTEPRSAFETYKQFLIGAIRGNAGEMEPLIVCADSDESIPNKISDYIIGKAIDYNDGYSLPNDYSLEVAYSLSVTAGKPDLKYGEDALYLGLGSSGGIFELYLVNKGIGVERYYVGIDCSTALYDVQREEDVSRLMTAVTHYEANNRGAIPDFTDYALNPSRACDVDMDGGPSNPKSFCGRYLIMQSSSADQFTDPHGPAYKIVAVNDYATGVSSFPVSVSSPLVMFENGVITIESGLGDYSKYDYTIHVIYSATCWGGYANASTSARKFAVLYKLEGDGVICQSN